VPNPPRWAGLTDQLNRLVGVLTAISVRIQEGDVEAGGVRTTARAVVAQRTEVESLRRELSRSPEWAAHVTTLRETSAALDTCRKRLDTLHGLLTDVESGRRMSKRQRDDFGDAVNECTDAIDRLHDHVITVTELHQRSRPQAAQQSRPVIRQRIR
jgi:hypothetical protein